MKITNKYGLPNALVRAVENDDYDDGGADITVSSLVGPPRLVTLRKRHDEHLEEDVVDRIWSLLGQTMHVVLERAGGTELKEQRLWTEVNGWKVSGKFDNVCLEQGVLSDYKLTSVWSVVYALRDGKAEWEGSTNLYAHLCALHGIVGITSLRIVAMLRDWNKHEAARNPDYPQQQVYAMPIPLWSPEKVVAYLEERVRLHQAARAELPACSDADVWRKQPAWAVKRKGAKKALRVFYSMAEANNFAAPGMDIEERPGVATRCAGYCVVGKCGFCSQWEAEKTKEVTDAA